jgi:hypothetical protein
MFGRNSIKEVYFATAANRPLSDVSWSIIAPPFILRFVELQNFATPFANTSAPSSISAAWRPPVCTILFPGTKSYFCGGLRYVADNGRGRAGQGGKRR